MSQPEPPTEPSKRAWTAASVALFVLGLLVLIPSGLCTGLIGILSLFSSPTDFGEFFVVVLPIAAIPMAVGAALVYFGLKARRRD